MVTRFQSDDIPALLADQGVDLTFAGTTVKAFLDVADEEILKAVTAPVTGAAIVFTFETDALPGIGNGSVLTSEGSTYTVRQKMRVGDGALTRAICLEG